MRRFRKKPVVIEAVQWDGSAAQATVIIDWVLSHEDGLATFHCPDECPETVEGHTIRIATLEGDMDARPGWWIIRGIKGEFYPCEPEVFDGSYEPDVDDDDTRRFGLRDELAVGRDPAVATSLADAWDAGFEAGDQTARAVNPEWPDRPQNPHR